MISEPADRMIISVEFRSIELKTSSIFSLNIFNFNRTIQISSSSYCLFQFQIIYVTENSMKLVIAIEVSLFHFVYTYVLIFGRNGRLSKEFKTFNAVSSIENKYSVEILQMETQYYMFMFILIKNKLDGNS